MIKQDRIFIVLVCFSFALFFVLGNNFISNLGSFEDQVRAEEEEGCTTNADCSTEPPYEICFDEVCLKGDVNNDGEINMSDFSDFKEDYISFVLEGWDVSLERSDFNVDETVSLADYGIFLQSYRMVNFLD